MTLNRIFLQWSDKLRYLGVHILYDLLGLKSLSISLNARSIVLRIVFLATLGVLPRKKLLYKLLFNSRFKCVPVLLYGLEACSLSKSDLSSIDFAFNRFFFFFFLFLNVARSCVAMLRECGRPKILRYFVIDIKFYLNLFRFDIFIVRCLGD